MCWEFGINRCDLLHIRWKNSKVLLYSTENYTQYPIINHNGIEYEEDIYITESFCCTIEVGKHGKSTW